MKQVKAWLIFSCMMAVCSACGDEQACDATHLCPEHQVCANSKCIDRCDGTSCTEGEACSHTGLCLPAELVECSDYVACADSSMKCDKGHCVANDVECSENMPCADPQKICHNGQCLTRSSQTCSDTSPCPAKNMICINNVCVIDENYDDGTCSAQKPCADGKTCLDGICKPLSEIVCYSDRECGNGYICDQTVCISESACSPTRKCKDSRVCHNGTCIDMPKPSCSKAVACPNASQTCVAGKCVDCQCGENESCQPDGSCLSKTYSKVKNANVGDPCTYTADYTACDGNRVVSCSQTVGQEDHATVKLSDCGTKVCAEASEDGVSCYEPCTNEGDFYGECFQDYNSESGTIQGIAFNSVCEKTADDKLIWTYVGMPEYCAYQCLDGNCVFIPESYATACTVGVTADTCIGDWFMFCDTAPGYNGGIMYGENCADYYYNEHQCAMDDDGNAACVTTCEASQDGQNKDICNYYLESAWYSDNVTCRKGKDGKYYWFSNGYTACASGCNVSTGACK